MPQPNTAADAALTLQDIRAAQHRIRPFVHRTPVLTSATLDELSGARLYFKCENFQKTGSFKARGAHNAVFSLDDAQARAGVVTHSSGNHAAALALAARSRGIAAYVVMPNNAPETKKRSVLRYGAQITFCEPTLQARETTAARLVKATGATFIHPYNDLRVMAGQGTSALELLEDFPALDAIVCPVGGGGHLSGAATAAKGLDARIQVFGAEPATADDAFRSFRSGQWVASDNPQTLADGLLTSLGELTFAVIRARVDDIVTVTEEEIVRAMQLVWGVMKIVIEPSAAVSVAAAIKMKRTGSQIGVILSGGNVDLDKLPWLK